MRIEINHPKIHSVDRDIFTFSFVSDCMTHKCRCRVEDDRQRNDACCQHGADVLVPEKNAILEHAAQIASVMRDGRRDSRHWFDERDVTHDAEAPGGIVLRTATVDPEDESSGCVFLEHTGERGCGLHVAAIAHGFDPAAVKPSVCRLYPLSWNEGWLGLSSDFDRYSCSTDGVATVYRVMRDAIAEIFGDALVRELDRVDARVQHRRLLVISPAISATDGD